MREQTQTQSRIARLLEILSYRRAHDSSGERAFLNAILRPHNPETDEFGNLYLKRGDQFAALWSCHVDTTHNRRGADRQPVRITTDNGRAIVALDRAAMKAGNCLGADNGAGVFVLLEMYRANVPGTYVFHRDEESGCRGSRFIAQEREEFLRPFKCAIAFDRYGDSEIITHQLGARTASDDFAFSLGGQMPALDLRPSSLGAFTDTESYAGLIPECTNVSCGYDHNHGPREILDLRYVMRLCEFATKLRPHDFEIARDPSEPFAGFNWHTDQSATDGDDWIRLIKECPKESAEVLNDYGINVTGGEAMEHAELCSVMLERSGLSFLEFAEEVYKYGGAMRSWVYDKFMH